MVKGGYNVIKARSIMSTIKNGTTRRLTANDNRGTQSKQRIFGCMLQALPGESVFRGKPVFPGDKGGNGYQGTCDEQSGQDACGKEPGTVSTPG